MKCSQVAMPKKLGVTLGIPSSDLQRLLSSDADRRQQELFQNYPQSWRDNGRCWAVPLVWWDGWAQPAGQKAWQAFWTCSEVRGGATTTVGLWKPSDCNCCYSATGGDWLMGFLLLSISEVALHAASSSSILKWALKFFMHWQKLKSLRTLYLYCLTAALFSA